MQIQSESILTDYSEQEKAAYLSALASLATADRQASLEEFEHFREISESAGLSAPETKRILEAADDLTGQNLKENLDALKNSNLRFSLVSDLIALAKVDGSYSDEERTNIEKIARHLQLNDEQYSLLDQAVEKAKQGSHSPEEIGSIGFLERLGLKNNFQGSSQNFGSMRKGIFGILAPMILGGMAAKTLGGKGKGTGSGRGLGEILGGAFGQSGMGGLGSLITGINKGRGNNSIGSMLSRVLR